MTNTQRHAENELAILENIVPDAIIIPFRKEILALCEAVGKSGQSGGSMPYTAAALSQAIKKLLQFETIAPLTGEDNEWMEVDEDTYQNIRDSRIFKQGKDGRAYFLDAISFQGNIGLCPFTSNGSVTTEKGEAIKSRQYIKSFPFKPKTFYIDVIDYRWKDKEETIEDPDGDWWTHILKDTDQLREVFEYYDKFE